MAVTTMEPVTQGTRPRQGPNKEDEALRQRINQALRAILADGTYGKINARYFPFGIY